MSNNNQTSVVDNTTDLILNELYVLKCLGDDLISPEEIAKAYGVSYTDEQHRHFTETLPNEQITRWLYANGYILVAGPPTELNLLEVRERNEELFYTKKGGWYENQKFAKNDKVIAGKWLAIRKGETLDPFNEAQKQREQQGLFSGRLYIPNAPEVSYAITTYHKIRGTHLLHSKLSRTSSLEDGGNSVYLGMFSHEGLTLEYYSVQNFPCTCVGFLLERGCSLRF